MRAKVIQFLFRLRASYWFIPLLMALASIALSIVTIRIDNGVGHQWLSNVGLAYANTPEGARSVLATIAGSMITVAGVTFSMTIVSVSFASAQFGPRLIGNFMRDRGNQFTLGTFIAAYIYCLLVLRTVRAAETISESETAATAFDAFVPHVSVLCGIALALASVGVLIYFIHHIPETIDVSNITASVGRELEQRIDAMFPDRIGEPPMEEQLDDVELPEGCFDDAREVATGHSGYIQAIDSDGLLRIATEHDLILRVQYRPGDFATENKILLQAWPAERVNDEVAQDLQSTFAWGDERTPTQNAMFLIDEAVEIIARALSPGINDPFTAISCLKWLQRSLTTIAERKEPAAHRLDDEGHIRVVAHATSFRLFCESIFGQTRQYVAADRNVSLESMEVIAEIAAELPAGERRDTLLEFADSLAEAAEQMLPLKTDRQAVRRRCELIHEMVEKDDLLRRLQDDQGWVGGRA